MKRCSRCGADILTGQLVCPHCGKPQRQPRQVRCRYCGTVSSRSLKVCPACGERLRHDWLRPILLTVAIMAGIVLGALVAPWLHSTLSRWRPSVAVSTVQAVASEVPVLVEVPSVTPSLTPSITPTPPPDHGLPSRTRLPAFATAAFPVDRTSRTCHSSCLRCLLPSIFTRPGSLARRTETAE